MGIPPRNMCQKVPCNVSNLLMHLCCDCFFVFPMSSSVKKIPFFDKTKISRLHTLLPLHHHCNCNLNFREFDTSNNLLANRTNSTDPQLKTS